MPKDSGRAESPPCEDLAILKDLDALHLRWPFYGQRKLCLELRDRGWDGLAHRGRAVLADLEEYAFGTDPTVSSTAPITYANSVLTVCGPPVVSNFAPAGNSADYRAVFCRRKNTASLGLTYTAEFSASLTSWVTNAVSPTVLATDAAGVMEVVSVPYPLSISTANGVVKPTFFRVAVTSN